MAVVAIIQARMGSSRLPGKVLMDLAGRPVLEWVVRAAAAIPKVGRVMVATSTATADNAIEAWCGSEIDVCRGHPEDVLDRFAEAARVASADIVVRVTGDCPFLDAVEAGKVVAPVLDGLAEYASNVDPPTYPDGLDCEVFTREALDRTARAAIRPSDREHVTPFMRDPANGFRTARIACPIPSLRQERWTLDLPEDLAFLRGVARHLTAGAMPSLREVLRILEAHPELRRSELDEPRNAGYTKSLLRDRAAAEAQRLDSAGTGRRQ